MCIAFKITIRLWLHAEQLSSSAPDAYRSSENTGSTVCTCILYMYTACILQWTCTMVV